MDSHDILSISIVKRLPLSGSDDTLEQRLRNVSLRGFEDVKIYENASFEAIHFPVAAITTSLFTPQPHIYRPYLDKIVRLADLFAQEGIDIFHLDAAYDYIAKARSGEETLWTMAPPIVERFTVPQHKTGGFDYTLLVGQRLKRSLTENNWSINPEAEKADYHNTTDTFNLINDGSHRIHAGLEKGTGITVLVISDMTPGFPYYAIPHSYSSVKVFDNTTSSQDLKVYTLTAPGHKQLYRLFPSGGIMSGAIRPLRPGEVEFV